LVVIGSPHRPPARPKRYFWYPFLLQDESNAGQYGGRKD